MASADAASAADLDRLAVFRIALSAFLNHDIKSDAMAAFDTHDAATLAALRNTESLTMLLLVIGVALALNTTGTVARAVLRGEEALRSGEERLRLAAEATGFGAYDFDPVAGLAVWSPHLFPILGLPVNTLASQDLFLSLIHPEDRAGFKGHLAMEIDPAGPGWHEVQFRIVRPDGEIRWLQDTGRTFFEEHAGVRRPVRGIGTVLDITNRKRAEEEIQGLNAGLEQRVAERTQQLAAVNRELETFSYTVAHDLRAPLRGMLGFVEILQQAHGDRLDAEGHRVLGVVAGEAQRMGALIDDLLAFSSLSRQKMKLAAIDMAAMVLDEFEIQARAAAPGYAPPRLELGPLPPAQGDPAMLRQVWANLLSNAIKFSRNLPAPVVEVGATDEPGQTTYLVKDHGVGFDEKHRHQLFQVFRRLHSDQEFEGTGIGLALVQRVVQRHGGQVRAQGKLGEGSTFHFTLPHAKEATP